MINNNFDSNLDKELLFGLLHNSHDSLKWMWQIVMGASLVIAVQTSYEDIRLLLMLFEKENNNIIINSVNVVLLLILVYIPLFFRVFYGNNRYIDLNYTEVLISKQKNFNRIIHLNQFTGLSRFIDILSLILHGILFIILGSVINEPILFIYTMLIFLVINILYLLFVVFKNNIKIHKPNLKHFTQRMYDARKKHLKEKPRNDALLFWIINNFIHMLLLIITLIFSNTLGNILMIYISIIILFSNSIFDIFYTWEFYFPDVEKFANLIDNKQ